MPIWMVVSRNPAHQESLCETIIAIRMAGAVPRVRIGQKTQSNRARYIPLIRERDSALYVGMTYDPIIGLILNAVGFT